MHFLCVVTCRVEGLSYQERSLLSDCNSGCLCSRREWDPVCGENGITYVSPCLAGCTSSTGSGRNTVRHAPLPPWHWLIICRNTVEIQGMLADLIPYKQSITCNHKLLCFSHAIIFADASWVAHNISVLFAWLFTYSTSVSCHAASHLSLINSLFSFFRPNPSDSSFVRCLTIAGV